MYKLQVWSTGFRKCSRYPFHRCGLVLGFLFVLFTASNVEALRLKFTSLFRCPLSSCIYTHDIAYPWSNWHAIGHYCLPIDFLYLYLYDGMSDFSRLDIHIPCDFPVPEISHSADSNMIDRDQPISKDI